MPFQPPRLDDRGYDDLVAELVARIPAHTPEWTNPRPGDPGRTLIELFAWLGDALLYRANLIPERQRLAFLRLLGTPLRPARPARGIVTVSLRENEAPSAFQIRPVAMLAGPVVFEARDEFTVVPLTGAVHYKRPADTNAVPPEVEAALSEFHANGAAIRTYFTTPLFAGGQALAAGVDIVADSADRCVWIALFAPAARPPLSQDAQNDVVRTALGGRFLNIGFVPALPAADPLAPAAASARVPHVWEVTVNTSGIPVDETRPWRPEYLALDEVSDTTAGLTRAGVVRLALPRAAIVHGPTNDVRVDPDAGVGDRPPRLDDTAVASRLVAWIRLRPAPPPPAAPPQETQFVTGQGAASLQATQTGAVAVPREVEHLPISWIGVNAIEIEQLETRANQIIGESSGAADQEFQLPATSVEAETLALEVEGDGRWDQWQRVDDLATLDPDADPRVTLDAARDARVFQLDAETGTILFGDGVRGRIPPLGRRIRARQLRSGGGAAGNLPPGTLKTIAATTLSNESVGGRFVVAQPMPLAGGADAETLREAERRIPSRLQHRERAVTADDYRTIARDTPGVAIGRVELLPRFKPQTRAGDIAGIVTVMALPDRPLSGAPNPRADRPFLEAVYAWIDARRPLATELYVIGCEYLPIAVSIAITVADDAAPDATVQAVKDAMTRALWPLGGGGFDGKGWPFHRDVSNRELAVEVARVAGVSEVGGLNLFARNTTSGNWEPLGDSRTGREQNLTLQKWQLPELLSVVVVADDTATGAPLTIGTDGGANPFADPNAVPLAVPVVPDLC
jgi:predicted phage baseplate assembly protein